MAETDLFGGQRASDWTVVVGDRVADQAVVALFLQRRRLRP